MTFRQWIDKMVHAPADRKERDEAKRKLDDAINQLWKELKNGRSD